MVSLSAEERRQEVQDPTEALFVVGFDPRKTFLRDLEGEFSRFGRLKDVEVKRNFAFIEVIEINFFCVISNTFALF